MRFPGFDSQHGTTAVPNAFFSDLLPAIDHLGELKVTLYAIRHLQKQQGPHPYLDFAMLRADDLFISGFGETVEEQQKSLEDSMARAVSRGTLLQADFSAPEGDRSLFLLNSPRGRAAIAGLEQGRWTPADDADELFEETVDRPNIFQLYEKNIGPLTPMLAEILREAEAEYPAEWIEEAIGIALENNVRKWRYVEAILKSRQEKGPDDREDRQTAQESGRKYIEGEFSDFIER